MCFLAYFHPLSATNTFDGLWDSSLVWILGFVLFSPVLPYVWHNAYGVEFWILDLIFYGFVLFSAPSAGSNVTLGALFKWIARVHFKIGRKI